APVAARRLGASSIRNMSVAAAADGMGFITVAIIGFSLLQTMLRVCGGPSLGASGKIPNLVPHLHGVLGAAPALPRRPRLRRRRNLGRGDSSWPARPGLICRPTVAALAGAARDRRNLLSGRAAARRRRAEALLAQHGDEPGRGDDTRRHQGVVVG